MADERHVVQIEFGVDVDSLNQGIDQGAEKLREGVERLNGLGNGESAPTFIPPPGTPPPMAPAGGIPAPAPQPATGGFSLSGARDELEEIRKNAQESPDLALLRLVGAGGSGGLLSQVQKSALGGEDGREHQEMLEAIRELTKGIRHQIQQTDEGGDPASSILGFLRGNALMQVGMGIAGDAMGGNVLGAGGSLLGGSLGFMFGGPIGAQAGATLGGMVGGGVGNFLGGASEAQDYAMMASEIAARFGAPEMGDREFDVDRMTATATAGYSVQDTAQLLDSLRQQNVIDAVDDEALELAQSIQELTRATGQNTEALVQSYAQYRTLGGEQSVDDYTANMIAGAVSVGMRQNLDQYQELVGSARAQLVYGGGVGDYDNQGQEGIQDLLYGLMGQQNRMSELLGENPMMAQQMLQSIMGTGAASSQFGLEAAMMQLAGIDAAQTTAGYIDPGQQTQNIIQRQRWIQDAFLGQNNNLGYGSMEELQAAARENPELVQQLITQGPNAQGLQAQLDTSIAVQYGKTPDQLSPEERQVSMQLLQTFLSEGSLTPETQTSEGVDIAALIEESQKTEGERAREAAAERHREMMDLMDEWSPLLTSMQEATTSILKELVPLSEVVAQELVPPVVEISAAIAQFLGSNLAQGVSNVVGDIQERGLGTAAAELVAENVANASPVGIFNRGINLMTGRGNEGFDFDFGFLNRGRNEEEAEEGDEEPSRTEREQGTGASFGTAPIDLTELGSSPLENRIIDAGFGDTPPGGVTAREDFNVFAFQPGDEVIARQGGFEDSRGGAIAASIIVQLTVPNNADRGWVEDAARRGAQSGGDSFLERWRSLHGNQPQLRQSTF